MDTEKGIIRFVPNALTLLRLVLTVIFLAMLLMAGRMDDDKPATFLTIAFVLFVVAAVTDIIDGKVARKYDVTSKFGRLVDPLADKILVCGAFICLPCRVGRNWRISNSQTAGSNSSNGVWRLY